MNLPQIITDNERKVKDALKLWEESMHEDNTHHKLGYGKTVGFNNADSTSGWDDFEYKVNKNMVENVQAIYEGLSIYQKIAVDHFHGIAVWRSNRSNLEDDYADALLAIEIGLRRRGLI